jgi:hypothetical protein
VWTSVRGTAGSRLCPPHPNCRRDVSPERPSSTSFSFLLPLWSSFAIHLLQSTAPKSLVLRFVSERCVCTYVRFFIRSQILKHHVYVLYTLLGFFVYTLIQLNLFALEGILFQIPCGYPEEPSGIILGVPWAMWVTTNGYIGSICRVFMEFRAFV